MRQMASEDNPRTRGRTLRFIKYLLCLGCERAGNNTRIELNGTEITRGIKAKYLEHRKNLYNVMSDIMAHSQPAFRDVLRHKKTNRST